MEPRKGQFPDGWRYSEVSDHYWYHDIFVKRLDRSHGMIELVCKVDDKRISVIAKGLWRAMRKLERRISKESEINL